MTYSETIGAAEAAPRALPSGAEPRQAPPRLATPRRAAPNRDESVYHRKLARVLDRMGATYTLDDILTRIGDGRMQSHVVANTWAITEISQFPRARMLRIVAVVGDMKDIDALHEKILAFADQSNCSLISALGRKGWLARGKELGWKIKTTNYLYHREM